MNAMRLKRTLLLCLLCLTLCLNVAVAADLGRLVIMHTNDVHGCAEGYAKVAALRREWQARGCSVLLLDAGDALQGTALAAADCGATVLELMNAAGYDAMALGNHEFDCGRDRLVNLAHQTARFPLLGANVLEERHGQPLTAGSVIVNREGVKVGVVGLTTARAASMTNPKHVRGLRFAGGEELYALAQRHIDELRGEQCAVVVLLTHMGGEEVRKLLERVHGVDVCVDGHDHQVKAERVNGALLVETGCRLHNVGSLQCVDGAWRETLTATAGVTSADEHVRDLLAARQAELAPQLGQRVGATAYALDGRVERVRSGETNLGDFCADALLWYANRAKALKGERVQAAIVNGGGLRASVPMGVITRGTLVDVMPFRNTLFVAKVKGRVLREMLAAATCRTPEPLGAFPQVAGLAYEVKASVPYVNGERYPRSTYRAPLNANERVVIKVIDGKLFDAEATYTVAMTEFLVNGGDAYGAMVAHRVPAVAIGGTDADALEAYLRRQPDGRVPWQYHAAQGRVSVSR